jgi:hypothetical protein
MTPNWDICFAVVGIAAVANFTVAFVWAMEVLSGIYATFARL